MSIVVLSEVELRSVIDVLYVNASTTYDIRALEKVWRILNRESYLCHNNHRLIGEEDHLGAWSTYCNYHFFEDHKEPIAAMYAGWQDLIKFDCQINQYVDDHYDSIDTSKLGVGTPTEFSKILRSLPKSKLLTYFDKLNYMGRMKDLADFFYGRRLYLLAEYNIKTFIKLNLDEPIAIEDQCHLLVGNGFTVAVSNNGGSYSTTSIIENAAHLPSKDYCFPPADLKDDFIRVIRKVNEIIASKEPSDLTERLRFNHWFCFLSEVSKCCDENSKINRCSWIIFRKCLARLHRERATCWSRDYEVGMDLFSFEELLYLLDAMFNEHERVLFRDEGGVTHIDVADYRLFSETIQKRAKYPTMLLRAINNAGAPSDHEDVRNSWRRGRFLSNANLVSCFTTNYDRICEDFFEGELDVIHLHGTLNGGDLDVADPCFANDVEMNQSNGSMNRCVIGIDAKEKLIPQELLDKISAMSGTLLVFGFSGDYDQHITERIKDNHAIKNIVYFQYQLEESLEDNPNEEQYFKYETFEKFQGMRKDVTIVDSKRLFE